MPVQAVAIYPTMHNTCCVLRATLYFSLFFFVNAMTRTSSGVQDLETPERYYGFSALLEMQFRNKSKKTCTGTVIADNVVITAARCLVYGDSKGTRSPVNLDLSFVVIGTKKMHGTGREQYLPIVRIQFHPELRTRHVDLAIVYTDAGIKTDRGGSIAKLIKNRVMENEREVTVVSWEPMSAKERKEKGLAESAFVRNDEEDVRGRHFPMSSSSESRQDVYLRAVSIVERYEKKQQHRDFVFSPYRRNLYDLGIVNKQSPNTLVSASFLLLKPLICRKFLERVRPNVYLKDDVMNMACFTSDTRFITDTDLGSGVFHNGKLFAVTVDHAELNLQYVGLALQVSCFCPWLSRKGGDEIHCAPKCCIKEDDDLGHAENSSKYVQAKPSETTQSDYYGGTPRQNTTIVHFTDFQGYSTYPNPSLNPSKESTEHSTLPSLKDKIESLEVHGKVIQKSYETPGKGHHESYGMQQEGYHTFPKPPLKENRESNEAPEIGHYEPEAPDKAKTPKVTARQYEPAELITFDAGANVNPMDSPPQSHKGPRFKSQDDLFYGLPAFHGNVDEGIPYTMELLTLATDSNARTIYSRLEGLEEYLVD